MPYIKKTERKELYPSCIRYAKTPGELNYQITELICEYKFPEKMFYQTINDIIGDIEGAKL